MSVKPKSRVSTKNSSQLTQFKFRWWMALILVAVVAVIGIVILRFSYASSVTNVYADKSNGYNNQCGAGLALYLQSSGAWCRNGLFANGVTRWRRPSDGRCAFMRSGVGQQAMKAPYVTNGQNNGVWVTVYETATCNV